MLRGARGAGRLRFGARDHAVGIGVEMLEHVAVAAVAATMPALTAMSPMLVWPAHFVARKLARSEEHTSELQSLMRISYAVFCLKKKTNISINITNYMNNSHTQIKHKKQ